MGNATSDWSDAAVERRTDVDALERRIAELESAVAEAGDLRRRLSEREEELEALRTSSGAFTLGEIAEARLRKANALLEAQLETSTSGILIVDRQGGIVAYNSRFLELWAIPRDQADARAEQGLLNFAESRVKNPDQFFARVQEIYGDSELECQGDLIELESGRTLSRNTQPVRLPNDQIIGRVWDFVDLTELRESEAERQRLEAQVQHAQKLESLGVLAGGIAHDFNNLLGGILGNLGLLLTQLPEVSPHRHYVAEAEKAAHRAADLASQMLAYSGKGNFVIEPIDLNQLVDDMMHLLEASISKKADLEIRLGDPTPILEGDPTQVRQVVMNLVTNASDALGDFGGRIVAKTGVMEADRAYLRRTYVDEKLPPGRYTFIEITDTGAGMTAATKSRIFDPFFTTKTTGRGLGMAVVLGIVRSHRGAITVDTQVGAGTTFRVLFPVCDHCEIDEADTATFDVPWLGKGVILVVDDEEMIRFIASESLQMAGFKVLTANDGYDALEIFREHAENIAAVLLDMSMPRLDGIETFQRMRRVRPDLRVVFSSGYNEQEAIHHLGSDHSVSFLKKPYVPKELVRKIRETVDKDDPDQET